MQDKKLVSLWAVFVFAAAFIVYSGALSNDFLSVWDDPNYITENPDVTGLSLRNIKAAFTNTYVGNYAPFHIISYALDYTLFGLNPTAFHAVNNILHGINAVMVMLLILRISGNLRLSVLSALVFALHPLQVESVAWVTERKNILSTTFALGSFLTYIHFLMKKGWVPYAGSLLLFAAALLTKSSVVVIPVLLCLYIFLYDSRSVSRFAPTIPFFILSAAASVAAVITQEADDISYIGGSPYATALTMVTVVVKYLRLFFFPVHLSPNYNPAVYQHLTIPVVLSMIILTALIAVLWVKRDNREVLFWAGWAVIPLLPVLQIIPMVTIMNDRYLYLPIIGLAPLTVKIIGRVARNKIWLVIVLLLLMSYQTYTRTKLWTAGPDLWLDAISHYPDNGNLYSSLGSLYQKLGQLDDSERAYQKALDLLPDDLEIHQQYGVLLLQMGKHREALIELQRVYDAGVRYELLISNLGYAYMDVGDTLTGMKYHKEVLSSNPRHANSIYGMAMGFEKLGDMNRAAVYWQRFLDVTPLNNPWRDEAKKRLEMATIKRR